MTVLCVQAKNMRRISFQIRWFGALISLSESNRRVYKLLSDERCLSVIAIMRIDAMEVTQLGQVRLNRFESPQASSVELRKARNCE